MRSIASLCQINPRACSLQLSDQLDAIAEAIAELQRAEERVQAAYDAACSREYAEEAQLAARDWEAPASYADIRGF